MEKRPLTDKLILVLSLGLILPGLLPAFMPTSAFSQERGDNFVYHYQQQVAEPVKMRQGPNNRVTVLANSRPGVLVAQFTPSGRVRWKQKLAGKLTKPQKLAMALGPGDRIWVAYVQDQVLTITNFSQDGTVNWQREYFRQPGPTNPVEPLIPEALIPNDQGVTFYGFEFRPRDTAGYVLALDAQGRQQDFQRFKGSGRLVSGIAASNSDGGLIAGYEQALFKRSPNGQIVFHKTYQSPFKRVANIQPLPNGGFYALLTTPTGSKFTLLKVDETGTLQWQTPQLQIPGSASTQASGLALAPDNGAVITGRINTAGTTPRNLPAVIKVKAAGGLAYVHYFKDTVTPKPVYANAFSIIGLRGNQANPYLLAGKSSQVQASGELLLARVTDIAATPQCVREATFSEGDRSKVVLMNTPLGLSEATNLTVNKTTEPEWKTVSMKRSVKCLSCSAVNVELGPDTTICPATTVELSTGLAGASHSWDFSAKDSSAIRVAEPGQYQVRVKTLCGQARDSITIRQFPRVEIDTAIQPADPDLGEPVRFTVKNPDLAGIQWQVDSATSLSGRTVTHTYEQPGRYRPVLRYTSPNDCRLKDTLAEIPVLVFELFLPDAFSPDADGTNEVFKPKGLGIQRYKLKVYNRWGEKVFSGVNEGWDGTINNQPAEPGPYLFKLKVRTVFQNLAFRKGMLTLIR